MALEIAKIIILGMLPVSELRGAIPYGILNTGLSTPVVFVLAVAANMLVIPLVFFLLDFLHPLFIRIGPYAFLFDKFVKRTRKKAVRYTEKYGWIGLMLFVAIPLPVTGAYTGTLAAWLLGIDRKRAMLALSLGVLTAGAIVTAVVITGVEAFLLAGRLAD